MCGLNKMTNAWFVVSMLGKVLYFSAKINLSMGRAVPGPVDYEFDRAGPGLGLQYMCLGWSGPRVDEPVANTAT